MKTCNITTHQRNVNKNHMRYHLTPLRMAIIKKDNKDVEKNGSLVYFWCNCILVQSLWKTVWRFLKKLKTVLTHDPSVSLLDIYPKKTKTLFQKHICTPTYVFTAALFTIDKIWRQPVSVDRWLDKEDVVYIYVMEYYSATKKKSCHLKQHWWI